MYLFFKASKSIGKGKSQLFRRKSELPHDITTINALDKHKRTQDYLTLSTSSDQSTAINTANSN